MKMDIQNEKLRLIEWIAGLNDPKTLNEFINLKKQREEDWWDTIGDDEREEIREGLRQADRGELVDHKTAMEKYQKWL
ncbi:MAG: hypothetical protein RLO17_15955 [Cyclobacteriaceae bacterium]